MTKVKTFKTRVVDKLGWEYKEAFVAIRHAVENSQKSYDSNDGLDHYSKDISSHTLSYTVSFWPDEATKNRLAGKGSRPLFEKTIGENGEPEFKEVFNADLEHPQAIQVQNSGASEEDALFRVIELDFKRRVQD